MGYFLALGTGNLCFDEVIDWVLEENYLEHDMRKQDATSSLKRYTQKCTKYLQELDELSKKLDATGGQGPWET